MPIYGKPVQKVPHISGVIAALLIVFLFKVREVALSEMQPVYPHPGTFWSMIAGFFVSDGVDASGLEADGTVLLAGTSLAVQPLIAPATMSQSGVSPVQYFPAMRQKNYQRFEELNVPPLSM